MTIKPADRVPYADTSVAPEKTRMEIEKMLYEFGIEAVRWTTIKENVELKFVVRDDRGQQYTVRVQPPVMKVRRRERGRYGEVQTQVSSASSMRLLFWWLKSKLEAISYGLVSFESEFLANIAGNLPGGQEVTVGDLLIPKLAGLDMTDIAKALPEPKKETNR